ncbi:MAG: 4Fe-4S binding protein [Veillonella sp.]
MLFTVNTEVCTRCGLCVADCPTGLLVMSDAGPVTGRGSVSPVGIVFPYAQRLLLIAI